MEVFVTGTGGSTTYRATSCAFRTTAGIAVRCSVRLYSGRVSVEQEGPSPGPAGAARLPWQVRAAGVAVGVEALGGLAFTVALLLRAGTTDTSVGLVLGQAGFFLLVAATLVAVAGGLVRGMPWARTPAIVTQLLLLPVAYSLIGPSRQLAIGVAVGVLVAGCFLLLISEAAREWSESDWAR